MGTPTPTTFAEAVKNTPVQARTENNMKALASTLRATTDLFYNLGASRGKNVIPMFESALQENVETALRILQWGRDVRGGAGERKIFRDLLLYLERTRPEVLLNTNLLEKVPELGRYDDLLIFETDAVRQKAFSLIGDALRAGNGLCAKWMPTKGKKGNTYARQLREFLGFTPKFYRKRLVELRKVVETQMCANEWNEINFSHVPSLAMTRYTKAFAKHAPTEFGKYKDALKKNDPTVKVNASAVYPHDVIRNLRNGDRDPTVANKQWEALPDYMNDANVLPLVDVSDSMDSAVGNSTSVRCLDVALALGLYCADKNKGAFKDCFLTFSGRPELIVLQGSLSQKMEQMNCSHWEMDTNLHAAFDRILEVAKAKSVQESEMPQILLILSDMQFNQCVEFDDSAIEMIRRKYEAVGYKVPQVVFWNLRATGNAPVQFNEKGCALVSGFSPSIMEAILAADMDQFTPEAVMMKKLASPRYDLTGLSEAA